MRTDGRIAGQKGFLLYLALSYLITWLYLIPSALAGRGMLAFSPPRILELVAAFGPAMAGLTAAGYLGGRKQLTAIFRSLMIWRLRFRWYLVALLLQPALWLLALGLVKLAGVGPASSNPPVFSTATPPVLVMTFLLQALSLLGEEIGWRGFALPHLLGRGSWLRASLILGFFWSAWHAPLFFLPGSTQAGLPVAWYLLDLLGTTFLFTWLYQQTSGSLLIATLFHASINTAAILLPILPGTTGNLLPYALGGVLKWVVVGGLVLVSRGIQVPVSEFSDQAL